MTARLPAEVRCVGQVWNPSGGFGGRFVQCHNLGRIERDGKKYCGVHDPAAKERREADRQSKSRRQRREDEARWAIRAAEESLVAAVERIPLERLPLSIRIEAEKLIHAKHELSEARAARVAAGDLPPERE